MVECLLPNSKPSERRRCSCKREDPSHDIGMSARTLAKSVMMMQRHSKQIRPAEAKQKRSAVSIGGEMVRGSRHAVVAAAYLSVCSARKSIGKLSGRRASAMRLCARRVSGAAHREQRCGLVVMDGWRPGAFRILAFWAGADEPQTREGACAGVFGGGPSIFSEGTKSAHLG